MTFACKFFACMFSCFKLYDVNSTQSPFIVHASIVRCFVLLLTLIFMFLKFKVYSFGSRISLFCQARYKRQKVLHRNEVFREFRWEVIVHFVDIGRFVDHYCLNFVFIISILEFLIDNILIEFGGKFSTNHWHPHRGRVWKYQRYNQNR